MTIDEKRRLHSLMFPDDLWETIQQVALDESKRTGRHVTASEVVRDGATREVRRLRRRLDSK